MDASPVNVVVGVGPGNGMALARRFSGEGRRVALLARRGDKLEEFAASLPGSVPIVCDVSKLDDIARAFADVRERMGPVSSLLYNAGSANWGDADSLAPEDLDSGFAINARGLFACVKQVLPDMRAAGAGVIGVIGATAALRGKPKTLAFAAGKAAQRSVAQSLARQLGPEGIHVFYLVVDGMVNLARTREAMPDRPDEDFLEPEHIAEVAWSVAQQPRSAWTFELDVRPFKETW